MKEMTISYTSLDDIIETGNKALFEALGPIGYARFFAHFSPGTGDYTAEREELLQGYTMESLKEELKKIREQNPGRYVDAETI
ncbi:MAG: hypothetical protein FWC67_01155 [Defluviitaleaceae bacterium]|nr:hypothetical protein [Defluviitaleaceae bacterium]